MGEIKSYKSFIKEIKKQVSDYYGDTAVVDLIEVLKNNGKKIEALNIVMKNETTKLSPVIYLEQIYDEYKNGNSVYNCIQKIIGIMENHETCEIAKEFDSIIENWNEAKEKLFPMLINTAENEELLRDLVSFPYLDLSVIFVIRGYDTPQGCKNVKVTKELLKLYQVTPEELREQALENMRMKDHYWFRDMLEVFRDILGEDYVPEGVDKLDPGKMYVLSNETGLFGASGILDEEFLKEKLGNISAFILPSSIHELIFCPEVEGMCSDYFAQMIQQVNMSVVSETDRLSDHPYYYDGTTNKVMVCA